MKPEFIAGDEKRFFEFIGNLQEKDKIAIISHTDPDGICSAVIASRIIKPDYIDFINYQQGIYFKVVENLKKRKISKVFFLDLVVEGEKEAIREIEKFAEIVVIDHHPLTADLNSRKTIFLKSESRFPATYLCYYLFSKIQKIPSWIVAVGIIDDMPQKYNEKNCNKVFLDFEIERFQCDLWRVVSDISFAIAYFKNKEKEVYDLLMRARNPEELKINEIVKKVRKDYEFWLDRYKKAREVYGNLIIFTMNPKYAIKSFLINKISSISENKDKAFIFIREEEPLSISARCQDKKINCPVLLQEAVKNIPKTQVGGHVAAAGARVPRKYLSDFKKNLIEAYKKLNH
ncbi:hypothetical protein FJZ19_02160 [Candidatus Pacearchaeota archaeon]|nr:hypothetical protein [Candidatus Pacearchaeota archaeon]